MKTRLNGKVDPNILFKKLKSISNVTKENNVEFIDIIAYDILEWTFLTLLNLDELYSIDSKQQILRSTFKQVVLQNKFDIDFFNETLNNEIKNFNSKPEADFYLLTSLSIKELPFKKITIGDSIIYITGKHFPKKFLVHRNIIIKSLIKNNDDSEYLKVVVVIRALDFKEGFEKAYQSLELFRAMLCLHLNSLYEFRFGSQSFNPINKIRQGQIFTLHSENGVCTKDNIWHDPHFKATKLLEFKAGQRNRIRTKILWLIKKFNLCTDKHKSSLSKALHLYVSAFDESNKYICFLRAWTTLESILDTDQNELVIKRCVALYHIKDRSFEKQILEGLRNYRNEYVHKGNNSLDPLVACFKIQEYIFNLIVKFNLLYAGFFNTIGESTLFLDNYNNADLKDLKSRKKILDKAISFKEKNMKI